MVGLIDKTNLFHVERVENRRHESLGEVRWEVFIEKLSSVCDEQSMASYSDFSLKKTGAVSVDEKL